MQYRADVDGLRAVAVIPVLLFHAGFATFSGGFVGVDVFFVISGFLITGVIQGDIDAGRFSIAAFYERRCRRILPALFVVLAFSIPAAMLLMLPYQLEGFGWSVLATTAFSSNIYFWQQSGYFSPVTEWMPLLHTWSLAVEEQYYIVFPVFMLFAHRLRSAALTAVLVATLLVSLLLSEYAARQYPSAAFYLTPFRVWELLIGVLVSMHLRHVKLRREVAEGLSGLGLAMILYSVLAYDEGTRFPGLAALVPCLGAAFIIAGGAKHQTLTALLLKQRLVVGIGLISYSLYLWHWPIFAFMRLRFAQAELDPPMAMAGLALSFLMASLSWYFVEQPFRRGGALSRKTIFRLAAASLAAPALAGFTLSASGFQLRELSASATQFAAGANDTDPYRTRCRAGTVGTCAFGGTPGTPLTYAIWGDSHAAAMRPAIETALAETGRRGTLLWNGACAPLVGAATLNGMATSRRCNSYRSEVIKYLAAPDNGIDIVFLDARWTFSLTGDTNETGGTFIHLFRDAQTKTPSAAENRNVFRRSLRRTIETLVAGGKTIVIIGEVPEAGWDVPSILALAAQNRAPTPALSREQVDRRQGEAEALLKTFARPPRIFFIPVKGILCSPTCRVQEKGRVLYSDDDHISVYAARNIVGPALKRRFSEAGILPTESGMVSISHAARLPEQNARSR